MGLITIEASKHAVDFWKPTGLAHIQTSMKATNTRPMPRRDDDARRIASFPLA